MSPCEPSALRDSLKPVRQRIALLVLLVAVSCSPGTTSRVSTTPRAKTSRGPDAAQLVLDAGHVSCHDGRGDVRSEGSGDRTGPTARPPRPPQPGSDLGGVSAERYRTGMTIVFGTRSRIPGRAPSEARLQYSFVASDPSDPTEVASVSAILSRSEWTIEVRDGDRSRILSGRPTVADDVLEVVLDADEVPAPMRGSFRWHALSEWAPSPSERARDVFSDFCPDTGFPRFRGTST